MYNEIHLNIIEAISTSFPQPQFPSSVLQLLAYILTKEKQQIKQNRKIGTTTDQIFVPRFVIITNLSLDSCKVRNMRKKLYRRNK